MARLDRYVLRLLLASFGFFTLVFTGVVWLTQTLRLMDAVVAAGQSATVFAGFAVLVLPEVFTIVLPLAAIAAALHVLAKLAAESELVVMRASGLGPFRLARPVAVFGALVMVASLAVSILAVPRAATALSDRLTDIRSDLASLLIREGQFVHPAPGITVFITETPAPGEIRGLFLHDQRAGQAPVTYSAEQARLIRTEETARLVMRDGQAITYGAGGRTLNTVRFEHFTLDLSDVIGGGGPRQPRPGEYPIAQLLFPDETMIGAGRSRGTYVAEGHFKLAMGGMAMLYPLIAVAVLTSAGFRRGGRSGPVIVAVAISVVLQVLVMAARTLVAGAWQAWPILYLPLILGAGLVLGLLWRQGRGIGAGRSRGASSPPSPAPLSRRRAARLGAETGA